MNLAETAKILALCAAYDQRTIGESDVAAWQAALEHVSFDDAKAAVPRYYRDRRDRIMPADVTVLVRAARNDRALRAAIDTPKPATEDRRSGHLAQMRGDVEAVRQRLEANRKAAKDRRLARERELEALRVKPERPARVAVGTGWPAT